MSCARCQSLTRRPADSPTQRLRHGSPLGAAPPSYGIGVADRRSRPLVQRKCGCEAGGEHVKVGAALVGGPGVALSLRTRRFFETRMHQNLGRVRIHDDSGAAAAARSIGARAFTIGSDISFAAGEFQPDSREGKRLLAHELAHVVQQGAAAAGAPQASLPDGGDAFEREADRVADGLAAGGSASPTLRATPAVQLQPRPGSLLGDEPRLRAPDIPPPPLIRPGSIREAWVVPMPPAPPQLEAPELGSPFRRRPAPSGPSLTLDPALRFTPVMIVRIPRCVPDRPLTWADFPGNNVPGGFGGITRMVTPQITVDGNPMFQARLNEVNPSAITAKVRGAANRAVNGCAPTVAACRTHLRANPTHTWMTARPNPDTCPASIISIDTATKADECETIVGAGCDAAAQAESARLLAHEQLHFDLSCKLVGRANDALIANTQTPAQLAQWLRDNLQPQQNRYDRESDHGCNAAGQATWVTNVANGLPAVPLPTPTPATP